MVTAQDVVEDAWDKSPPAVVIYIIDPFSFATESPEMNRIASLGLLKCYSQVRRVLNLPKGILLFRSKERVLR